MFEKHGAADTVEVRPATRRRKRQTHAGFRQSIHRRHRRALKAIGREARAEVFDGVGADRFGAVEGHAPTGQIETFKIGIAEFSGAQFVGKIRRRRQCAAMPLDGAQPALRPRDESQRRHQHQREAVIERAETGADQAHVVIQRQPTDEHIVGS